MPEIEIKEMFTRYTNDVIASTAFGFKINSYENRENEFFVMGKKATNFSGWQFLKFQGYATFPKLMKVHTYYVVNSYKRIRHNSRNDCALILNIYVMYVKCKQAY